MEWLLLAKYDNDHIKISIHKSTKEKHVTIISKI